MFGLGVPAQPAWKNGGPGGRRDCADKRRALRATKSVERTWAGDKPNRVLSLVKQLVVDGNLIEHLLVEHTPQPKLVSRRVNLQHPLVEREDR